MTILERLGIPTCIGDLPAVKALHDQAKTKSLENEIDQKKLLGEAAAHGQLPTLHYWLNHGVTLTDLRIHEVKRGASPALYDFLFSQNLNNINNDQVVSGRMPLLRRMIQKAPPYIHLPALTRRESQAPPPSLEQRMG